MRTAIVYYSQHHGNTRKLLDAIASKYEVTLIDVTSDIAVDLNDFDRIGFASGIYYSSMAKQIIRFAEEHLPEGKEVFFIGTCGTIQKPYFYSIRAVTDERNFKFLGEYICFGFDTFGPFKLVGGIAKGHPTEEEIGNAVKFYKTLER